MKLPQGYICLDISLFNFLFDLSNKWIDLQELISTKPFIFVFRNFQQFMTNENEPIAHYTALEDLTKHRKNSILVTKITPLPIIQ